MKYDGLIVDADFCIKIGASPKYRYLERILAELAEKVYIHKTVYDEIMVPACAKQQIDSLIHLGIMEIVDENCLEPLEKAIYRGAWQGLSKVMINPGNSRKNRGETCSLAMAKAMSIPIFATDEKNLQPIIGRILNTGISDIKCLRIEDVIKKIKSDEINTFTRKESKVLWRLAGKNTDDFDKKIWPI